MLKTRVLFAALAGGAGACLCVPVCQAQPVTLNVRPGLWETTTSDQNSGVPPIPAEVLARMTPQQRVQFEKAMAAAVAHGNAPRVDKSCLTKKRLQRGFDTGKSNAERKCTRTIVSSTASTMDVREECTGGGSKHFSAHIHFKAPDPVTVNGTINVTISGGERTLTMKQVMHAKWLGADCGKYAREND